MKPHRLYAAGPLAMAATFGLFLTMNALVAGDGEVTIDDTPPRHWVDFLQIPNDPPEVNEIERVEPPLDVMDTPDPMPVPPSTGEKPNGFGPDIRGPKLIDHRELMRLDFGAADGDYLPLVRIQPTYPRRAQERGIEGYAVVELTVNADGSVPPNSVVIIDAEPKGYFENEAIKAARKFKYKPKVVNGVGQVVSGVHYRFSFNISD